MSDVTAVVLSIGESYTERAVASVRTQSEPVHEILVVEDVAPFHRALNEGARRVTTPYFVQVDSDMVLDPDCVARLRAMVQPDTGIAVAELRDPLMGQVVGIKLFRTACFRGLAMPDSISPDTDFVDAIQRAGWRTEYLGDTPARREVPAPRPTLGEHRPDYTPSYAFRKFSLEGRRCRYRGARNALLWRFAQLDSAARTHPAMANIADLCQVAVARGFFLRSERDDLTPDHDGENADRVWALVTAGVAAAPGTCRVDRGEPLGAVFRRFVALGEAMAVAPGTAALRGVLRDLVSLPYDWHPAIAKIGLCYGFFDRESDRAARADDERALRDFVRLGVPAHASISRRAVSRAALLRDWIRGRRVAW